MEYNSCTHPLWIIASWDCEKCTSVLWYTGFWIVDCGLCNYCSVDSCVAECIFCGDFDSSTVSCDLPRCCIVANPETNYPNMFTDFIDGELWFPALTVVESVEIP